MEIAIYFETKDSLIDAIKSQTNDLPGNVALLHSGEDEGKVTERDITKNALAFDQFIGKNEAGFFLYNDDAKVLANVNLVGTGGYPSIEFMQEDSSCTLLLEHVDQIVSTFTHYGAFFIYACLDEERDAKNRNYNDLDGYSVETWVGRDISKYIPGLYWVTWISDKYSSHLNIDIEEFVASVNEPAERLGNGYCIRLGDKPELWRDYLKKLSKLSRDRDYLFNIDKVNISSVKTLVDMEDVLFDWE